MAKTGNANATSGLSWKMAWRALPAKSRRRKSGYVRGAPCRSAQGNIIKEITRGAKPPSSRSEPKRQVLQLLDKPLAQKRAPNKTGGRTSPKRRMGDVHTGPLPVNVMGAMMAGTSSRVIRSLCFNFAESLSCSPPFASCFRQRSKLSAPQS